MTNTIDPVVAKRWMGEAIRVYDDLDAQKIENMNVCRTIRARLPDIYESAKNAGVPLRAFKLAIKQQLIERKIEGLQEDIDNLPPDDEDDAAAFEMLQAALGGFADTPLGQAAVSKAEARKASKSGTVDSLLDDDEKDLRPRSLREKDAGEANGDKVAAGIKPLN